MLYRRSVVRLMAPTKELVNEVISLPGHVRGIPRGGVSFPVNLNLEEIAIWSFECEYGENRSCLNLYRC